MVWIHTPAADNLARTMRSHGPQQPTATASAARTLGLAVRTRRRALGLDQLVLCDLAGVGPAFLYSLEHGKPTVRLDKVVAVLAVLGLELRVRPGRALLSAEESLREAQG